MEFVDSIMEEDGVISEQFFTVRLSGVIFLEGLIVSDLGTQTEAD